MYGLVFDGYIAMHARLILLPIFIIFILEYGVFSEIHVGHLEKKNNFILTDEILEEIEWKGTCMCVTPIILTQGQGCRSCQSNHGWISYKVCMTCKCAYKPLL